MLYVARQAYESKTGEEMPWPEPRHLELVGPEWDEDSLPGMYPRLWEKARA